MRRLTISLFSAGIMLVAACGGAQPNAPVTTPLTNVAPPVGSAPPLQTGCPRAPGARSATESDHLLAHAAVKDELVGRKKEKIEMTRTFAPAEEKISDEELERRLAAVDEDEARGKGASTDETDHFDLANGITVIFFHGNIPTDAGGIGDMSSWGIAVVRTGCTWRKADVALTSSELQVSLSKEGFPVLVQTQTTGQCDATTKTMTVTEKGVKTTSKVGPRSDMEGVCNNP